MDTTSIEDSGIVKHGDIDIDFADRTQALTVLRHVPASIARGNELVRHNTGVYFTEIPVDPELGIAGIDHETAENRGYYKLDLLNVHVYSQVRDEQHLLELMARPVPWQRLSDPDFFARVIHINNHYAVAQQMPEPVDSIERMSMFLSLIRPGKRHLVGLKWADVAKTVWDKTEDGYSFKKAHAVGYSHLVAVHMNLLDLSDQSNNPAL